jgi:hypothetical protein
MDDTTRRNHKNYRLFISETSYFFDNSRAHSPMLSKNTATIASGKRGK